MGDFKIDDYEKSNKLLLKLQALEEFQLWKDTVVGPELTNIEVAKQGILKLTEAEAKALILYEMKIKSMFDVIFKVAQETKDTE